MAEFLPSVLDSFQSLLDWGLLTVHSSVESGSFDNALVILRGKNVLIRLVRDRGDTMADVASTIAPDDWNDIHWVLGAMGLADWRDRGLLTPAEAAAIVERFLPELEKGLDNDHIVQTSERLAAIRAERKRDAIRRFGRHGDP